MNKIILFFSVVIFVSCSRYGKGDDDIVITDPKPARSFSKGVKTVDVAIGESLATVPVNLSKNLYGKFFYDRAEYYVIDNPTNKLWGKAVLQTTLYYFDGQLYKVRHLMEEDISSDLINGYRKFKIKALDSLSRSVLKSQAAVFRMNDHLLLNDNLSRYELTWDKGTQLVKWKTSEVGEGKYFEYSECLADYRKKYRELEVFEMQY
jgi:hypothetical protein